MPVFPWGGKPGSRAVDPIRSRPSSDVIRPPAVELTRGSKPEVAGQRAGTDSTMKRSQPQPPHTGGTFRRGLQPLYTEKHNVCAPLPPQHKPHATFMQPVHCVLQHHVANLHVSTHMATKRDTNHAAIPLCNHSFHQLPKHPVTTHRRTTTCCRTESRNRFDDETIATATATHRRYLSSPAAATLHGKTQGSCSGFFPNTSPMQHSSSHYNAFCSITCKPACIYAHAINVTPIMQPFTVQPQLPSASKTPYKYVQTNNHSLQNREQEPIRRWNDRSRNRPRYLSSPAAATLHGKTRGFVLRLPHNTSPMQHACSQHKSLQCVSQPKIPKHHMYVTAMRRNMRNTSKQLLHCGLLLGLAEQARTRRTHEVLLIAGCSQFTRKNIVFCAPASPQHNKPHATVMQPLQCVLQQHLHIMRPLHYDFHPLVAASIVKSQTTICDKKFRTTLHECIVMWCKVSQPHTTLHNVLLCDVKSHTTLHECIVMWCKVSPPFMMSCYVM